MPDDIDREFFIAAMDVLLSSVNHRVRKNRQSLLISVIMPVYNRAETIVSGLESLQQQSSSNFELIVIDDGSTDHTAHVIAEWQVDHPWLRVLTNEQRSGASKSRNRALTIAKGEVIAYLDSDNTYYPHALQSIAEVFQSSPGVWSMYASHIWIYDGAINIRCPHLTLAGLIAGTTTCDLNAFAHRRALYDAVGGFDETLNRLIDWEFIIRLSKIVMPLRLPTPIGVYRHGKWPRISNEDSLGRNRHLVSSQHVDQIASSLRVLYVVHCYPQVSETYIVSEYRHMLTRGVTIEIWSEVVPAAPDTDLAIDDSICVHRATLTEAIASFKPDLIHIHWLNVFERYETDIAASGVPGTIRGHSFDFSRDSLTSLQNRIPIKSIYVFPTQVSRLPEMRDRIHPVSVSFDPKQYFLSGQKTRDLVVRTGVALRSKDLESFIEIAARCKQHKFVLLAARTVGDVDYIDKIVALNVKLDSPVSTYVDRPASEVATWVALAAIYLHGYNAEISSFGMPISIAEAMATGSFVLARRSADAVDYVGSNDRLYSTNDEAVKLIESTLSWTNQRWAEESAFSVDTAFLHYAPSVSTQLILDDWLKITGVQYLETFEAATLISVEPEEVLQFKVQSRGASTRRAGFHAPETWGLWAGQTRVSIAFSTEADGWSDVSAMIITACLCNTSGQVTAWLNGVELSPMSLTPTFGLHQIQIDRGSIKPGGIVDLVFEAPRLMCPRDYGSSDRRLLGMGLQTLQFVTLSQSERLLLGGDEARSVNMDAL